MACVTCGAFPITNAYGKICRACATTDLGHCRVCGEPPARTTDWWCDFNDPSNPCHACFNCAVCGCDACQEHRSAQKALRGAALRAALDAKAAGGGKKKKK